MAKHRRVMKFSNDTAQSLITVEITGAEGVGKYLDTSKRNVLRLADNLTVKTSAEARRRASAVERRMFTLGERNEKWVKNGYQEGGSIWSEKLGGYKSIRPIGNGKQLNLTNFSYVTTAEDYQKGKTSPVGTSEVRMTSQLANLWENDALYTKPSAIWKKDGKPSRWGLRGETSFRRPGKHYFEREFTNALKSSIPEGIKKAKKKFREDQRAAKENKE